MAQLKALPRPNKEIEWPPLPDRIEGVAGPIKILRKTGAEMDKGEAKGDNNMGLCQYHTREIWIRRSLKRNVAWHTLVHEIYHAKFYDLGLLQRPRDELLAERMCDCLATARLAILRQQVQNSWGELAPSYIQSILTV
jgi:hypothetical protein